MENKKPLALDLFCGKGGWSHGLMANGWECIGVDIEDMGGYPGKLVLADVLEIAKDPQAFFPGVKFDLVVASPPCQEFSYSSFPFKKAREKFTAENPPDKTLWMAAEEIAHKLGVPLVLENVRGAVKWMGKAANKYGPFYLWGDVPVLLPYGKPQKGFGKTSNNSYQSRGGRGPINGLREGSAHRGPLMSENRDKYKRIHGAEQAGSHGTNARKEWSAKAAMIPFELAWWIGEVHKPC